MFEKSQAALSMPPYIKQSSSNRATKPSIDKDKQVQQDDARSPVSFRPAD